MRPNDAAMPYTYTYEGRDGTERDLEHGLTKREYIAIEAMKGLIAAGVYGIDKTYFTEDGQRLSALDLTVKEAVVYADKLIQQLSNEG